MKLITTLKNSKEKLAGAVLFSSVALTNSAFAQENQFTPMQTAATGAIDQALPVVLAVAGALLLVAVGIKGYRYVTKVIG